MSNDLTTDFFENNDQALRQQNIVVRDSLGSLAIHVLESREDLSKMSYDDMLRKLYQIVDELHETYQRMYDNFT